MNKRLNGILLAGTMLAASAFVGAAVAGETATGEAFSSWDTVAETDLSGQRAQGAVFNFDDINIESGGTGVSNSVSTVEAGGTGFDGSTDNSVSVGPISDSFQANGALGGDGSANAGTDNSGAVAADSSVSTVATDSGVAVGTDNIATADGAAIGNDGTAVGANNSGAVATGEGTTAISNPVDSFNTSEDEYQIGYASSEQTLDVDVGGDVGMSGAITNVMVQDVNGISINNFNTGLGNNFATTFTLQVNLY